MKDLVKFFTLSVLVLSLSGCVVSQYKNKNGEECTRRYFTVLGIPVSSCHAAPAGEAPAEAAAEGTPIQIAPAAPSPSLRQSTPAKTIEQSIKAIERVR